ncbi:transcriptional regulator [Paucilactobacillus suebicus DSM 5007 = KCTC 3549]|uniref:Transcriptional regulator n=2 Tax=Paucilactobacillus suebicus TaxID=152335 RepID=A0A0R1W6Y5_9LACO|nr:transcriptional regulator [Paucilactobacillus suebicus DSM 5007 = KCTC 3549]
MIAGVLGGIGEYFGINANYLRIGFVIISVLLRGFPGILVYILLAVIMPPDPNRGGWADFFSSLMGGSSQGQQQEKKTSDRKVLHDVDEHDENDEEKEKR